MYREQIILENPNRPAMIREASTAKFVEAPPHFHKEIEILYIAEGEITCSTDSASYPLKEGDIVFINSNIPHRTKGHAKTHLIQFKTPSIRTDSLKYLVKMLSGMGEYLYVFHKTDEDYEEMLSYILNMLRENKNKESSYNYYITANIYLITALLHRKGLLCDIEKYIDMPCIDRLLPALKYIEENYNRSITLDELAQILNISKFYFSRLFSKATGTSAVEYINYVRVSESEKMLKTDMSISEVCYAVGFSALSYFNKTFKKYKQCSPSAYRKTNKNKEIL